MSVREFYMCGVVLTGEIAVDTVPGRYHTQCTGLNVCV